MKYTMVGEATIHADSNAASTATTFERLTEMPECFYATDDCLCSQRFAKGVIGTMVDMFRDTTPSTCPKNRIVEVPQTGVLFRVDSVFSTRPEPPIAIPPYHR